MTTIAIKDGTVAFDSRVSDSEDGSILINAIDKCWVSPRHPVIYCGYGDVTLWYQAAHYIDAHAKLPWEQRIWLGEGFPDLGDDSGLLVVTRAGTIYAFEGCHFYRMKGDTAAAGSGFKAAHAAMLCGAPAEDAVEIAIMLDSSSGPPVNVLRLKDIPHAPALTSARTTAASGRCGPQYLPAQVRRPEEYGERQQPGRGRIAARTKRRH